MKILKIILLVVAILIAIPLITALFVKKDYAVEREIVINRSKDFVFDYIKLLKNQDNFSKWATMDPHMKKSYDGIDGTVGFISAWDSEKKDVGKGEQEIKKIEPGARIDFELRFIEPFESKDQAHMTTEALSDSTTRVKWGFDGHMDYPMNIMLLCMDFDKMLGGDLEIGLQNLKTQLEK